MRGRGPINTRASTRENNETAARRSLLAIESIPRPMEVESIDRFRERIDLLGEGFNIKTRSSSLVRDVLIFLHRPFLRKERERQVTTGRPWTTNELACLSIVQSALALETFASSTFARFSFARTCNDSR